MSLAKITVDILSRVAGVMLIGSGAIGWYSPMYFAPIFGIPHPTPAEVTFYQGLAGRNFAAGLAVTFIALAGQKKALGILLAFWSIVGIADTHVLLIHPEGENIPVHLFNVCWLLATGLGLLKLW